MVAAVVGWAQAKLLVVTMPEHSFLKRCADLPPVRHFPRIVSILLILSGSLALLNGHGRAVLPLLPNNSPMHYNTTLCFIIASVGLLLLTTRQVKMASWLGLGVVAFAGLVGVQYAISYELHIDQPFHVANLELIPANLSRMSLLTSACFILIGLGLSVAGARQTWSYRLAAAGLLACIVTVIAGLALVGYLFDIEVAYSWGASQMTLNSSLALLLLGGGLLAWAWLATRPENFNFLRWLPITSALTLMLIIAFISAVNLLQLKRTTYWRGHTLQALLKAQAFEDQLIDLQHTVRVYVTSGDPKSLALSQASTASEPRLLAELFQSTENNPQQQQHLKKLTAALAAVFSYDQQVIAGYREQGAPAVAKMDATGENWRVFGQARDILKIFIGEQQKILDAHAVLEKKNSDSAAQLLGLSSVTAALLLLFANQMTSRELRQRRQTEEHLRESEERFRLALDNAPIGMAIVSPQGRWIKVNRAVCDMLGYSEIELLAADFQRLTHPGDLPQNLEFVRQILAGEIPTYQMEKRYFHKDGTTVFALLRVALVRSQNHQPLYFVSQMENISERKRIEAEREKLIGELQHALAQVKSLSGMIPICGWCKNVRSDEGYWQTVEQFVRDHTDANFSHGMCPKCAEKFQADITQAKTQITTVKS